MTPQSIGRRSSTLDTDGDGEMNGASVEMRAVVGGP